MPRPEKVQAVADIKESLEGSEAVFLTEYRGLTVKAVQELRASLRASGAEYKVVKMTLARRAADGAGMKGLNEHLLGPTALAFAKSDPVATAKALKEFAKTHDVFVMKAGVLSGNILSPEEVSRLAEIEPREVLLAKIAGAAKAPLAQAAGLFASFNRNAASMFKQLLDKKESGEYASAGGGSDATLPAEEPVETDAAAKAEAGGWQALWIEQQLVPRGIGADTVAFDQQATGGRIDVEVRVIVSGHDVAANCWPVGHHCRPGIQDADAHQRVAQIALPLGVGADVIAFDFVPEIGRGDAHHMHAVLVVTGNDVVAERIARRVNDAHAPGPVAAGS